MGDNKEFKVKAQTRKQGGNGTIQQMATESRSDQKKQKKNVRNGSLVYVCIINICIYIYIYHLNIGIIYI